MSVWTLYLYSLLICVLYMTLIFVIALWKDRFDIADVGWGAGFILLGAIFLFMNSTHTPLQLVLIAFVTIWGLRLSFHLYLRNKKRNEDFRYNTWKKQHPSVSETRIYIEIFLIQAIIMSIVALPLTISFISTRTNLPPIVYIGGVVWTVGFLFEALADYQLYLFKKDPKNKGVLNRGLWRYSRHPNYFGEATMWWGLFLIVLSVPQGVYAIFGPLLITYMLLRVSGLPRLEKERYAKNSEYKKYREETSSFIPLPKK